MFPCAYAIRRSPFVCACRCVPVSKSFIAHTLSLSYMFTRYLCFARPRVEFFCVVGLRNCSAVCCRICSDDKHTQMHVCKLYRVAGQWECWCSSCSAATIHSMTKAYPSCLGISRRASKCLAHTHTQPCAARYYARGNQIDTKKPKLATVAAQKFIHPTSKNEPQIYRKKRGKYFRRALSALRFVFSFFSSLIQETYSSHGYGIKALPVYK